MSAVGNPPNGGSISRFRSLQTRRSARSQQRVGARERQRPRRRNRCSWRRERASRRMTRAIPAIDSIVRASRDASRPPGCSPSRCRNALAGRVQRDEHRDDRADEHRRSTADCRARVGRALSRKVAGPCLQRRVVHCHRGRLVGERLGREPVRRGLQDRRSARRGRARFRREAVSDGQPRRPRPSQQEARASDAPCRNGLRAGAPPGDRARRNLERDDLSARRVLRVASG